MKSEIFTGKLKPNKKIIKTLFHSDKKNALLYKVNSASPSN